MTLGESGPPRGVKVPARSRAAVRRISTVLRGHLNEAGPYIDVQRFIEHKLLKHFDVTFVVRELSELGVDEGRAYPDERLLELRSDVYDLLAADDPRARFTAMHEVGHLFLHRGVPLRFAAAKRPRHQHYEDSEWQSDCFAAEILMPVEHVLQLSQVTAAAISSHFGVSLKAAIVRLNVLLNEGLLQRSGKKNGGQSR